MFDHCEKLFLYSILISSSVLASQKSNLFQETNPIVTVFEGQLRGRTNLSRDGRIFYEFLGIRYAKLNDRFQMASSPDNWQGVWNATEFGSKCLTYYSSDGQDIFDGEEDCLFLNVYTPKLPQLPQLNEQSLLPTMVFFHEGGFLLGSGNNYGSHYIMDEDVVIVTINYRLSALGFLSTENEDAPGNMGLKDQVKSLEWVQRNIAPFNGDPNKVTIFGYSAGGASVTYHLMTRMSQGLFQRAIAQSGSALNPWAFASKPLQNAKVLANALNCSITDSKEMVACLRSKDAKEIVKLQRKPFVKWFVDPLYVFVPSVEKIIEDGSSNFLIRTPREIIDSGSFPNDVPLMTGSVKEDGLLLHGAIIAHDVSLSEYMDSNWDFVAPITFFYEDIEELDTTAGKTFSQQIRSFYFNVNDSIGWDTKFELAHAYSDRWFLKGVKDFAFSYARKAKSSVFNYIVTYNKLIGEIQLILNSTEKLDISHGDDLQLFFKSSYLPEITKESEHYNMSKIYIKLWTNFANYGNPLGFQETGTNWIALRTEESRLTWFHIDDNFQQTSADFTDRSDFWNTLPVPMTGIACSTTSVTTTAIVALLIAAIVF